MAFKGRFLATIILLIIMGTQLMSPVHCRALRLMPEPSVSASGADEQAEGVSSSSSTRSSVRGLAFILASGPSKKGLDYHWFLSRALIKVTENPLSRFVARAWKKA
ncbi:hypothetical protein Fot_24778 [Forsythia ovata]|uniref:Uncharacterized protein n=1 Tax=Forsythia ovata TaxID=205694 RepID=A0ABD1U784_9LAMI